MAAKIQSLASVMNDANVVGVSLNNEVPMLHIGGKQAGFCSHTATPEGAITAGIGSVCIVFGGAADSQLFIKETGDFTNTGWVAQAT